jgi:uncharacterized protein YjbI with pentapeptide repeats
MAFIGRGGRHVLQALLSGLSAGDSPLAGGAGRTQRLVSSQFVDAELDGFCFSRIELEHTGMIGVNANDTVWDDCRIQSATIRQSSFMRAMWKNSDCTQMRFDGATLIRNRWAHVRFTDCVFSQSSMVNSEFRAVMFRRGAIQNVEALNARLRDTLFLGTRFSLDEAGGMNGFAGAVFENCVFYRCRFEGSPLAGSVFRSCVFCGCRGITMEETMGMREPPGKRHGLAEARELALSLDEGTARAMLAELLADDAHAPDNALDNAVNEGRYANFAQAIIDLKRRYGFSELAAFSTEADLVYLQTAERRILLSDPARPPEGAAPPVPPAPRAEAPGKKSEGGRFSHLELCEPLAKLG